MTARPDATQSTGFAILRGVLRWRRGGWRVVDARGKARRLDSWLRELRAEGRPFELRMSPSLESVAGPELKAEDLESTCKSRRKRPS